MGGVEVIRVGMRLQKIAQRREVFAKMGRTGRSIRPQIQKKISIDGPGGKPGRGKRGGEGQLRRQCQEM